MEKLLHGEHPVTLLRVGKNSLSLLVGWTRIKPRESNSCFV